jgi:hypothetical protein
VSRETEWGNQEWTIVQCWAQDTERRENKAQDTERREHETQDTERRENKAQDTERREHEST